MRYQKNIGSGVLRIPQPVREDLGDEIEIIAVDRCALLYPKGRHPVDLLANLRVVVQMLEQSVREVEAKESRPQSVG